MHHNEDTVFIEILDVETGQPVAPGESGNLVATSLHRTTPPFIRYNLRDLFRLYERTECPCGVHTRKLSTFLGRSDEMIKLRSQTLYPRACQSIIAADGRTTGEFICIAHTVGSGATARTEVTVRVERRSSDIPDALLAADLRAALHRDLGVRLDVEVVEARALAEQTGIDRIGERKIRRLIDLRKAPGSQ
jgi:phenylacetate-CoA ligase